MYPKKSEQKCYGNIWKQCMEQWLDMIRLSHGLGVPFQTNLHGTFQKLEMVAIFWGKFHQLYGRPNLGGVHFYPWLGCSCQEEPVTAWVENKQVKLVDSKSQKESLVWGLIMDTTRLLHVLTIQQFKSKSDVIGMCSLFS